MKSEDSELSRLKSIVAKLRSPEGCPWDRKQTIESLAPYVLEEGFELVEAIEKMKPEKIREEAGDLLMVVMMICRVAEEKGLFDVEGAARSINEKLIRRHPHVFGNKKVNGPEEVLDNWEKIKLKEREKEGENRESILSGVPRGMPALMRALRIGEKASRVGFDWPTPEDSLEKIKEEMAELEKEASKDLEENKERIFEEMGDLLFAVANAARLLKVNPEMALRAALDKFQRRFMKMERMLGKPLDQASFKELDDCWNKTKD